MMWQVRLCRRFKALSLFGCGPSISLGPIHGCGLPACNHRRVSDSPTAATKDEPRWLMLNPYGCRTRTDDSFVADAKTVADARTSTGRPLRVSLGRAAPPASSFLYYHVPDSTLISIDGRYDYVSVIAAHKDSVLLHLNNSNGRCPYVFEDDHFVYTAGDGPPSLSLVPVRNFLTKSESIGAQYLVRRPFRPTLYSVSTGLLRRGENDLLVVQLELWYDRDAQQEMLEFCVLRTGSDNMRQWELMEPVPIRLDDDEVVPQSSGHVVIPVGDRYLCWIDHKNGFYLCDMADEASPKVRYVPVPGEVIRCCSSGDDYDDYEDKDLFPMEYTKKMGAAGASRVRFVSIDPHCCCGGPGRSTCAHSRFAFTVKTWTMDLSMAMDDQPLAWVKDGEMDCEEVWALPGYEGLPRANLLCPVVSLDNPDVVCFLLSNRRLNTHGEDRKVWMIQLDMKAKTLLSVVQFTGHPSRAFNHLPVELQY